jgi:S1-C subfamily serine protease
MGHAGDSHDDEPPDEQDDEGTERGRGPVPDPLDRVWRHPTELPPVVPATAATPRRAVPTWLTAVVAGGAGAVVAVVLLAAIGAFDEGSSSNPGAAQFGGRPTDAALSADEIAESVGSSVVSVLVRAPSGEVTRGSGVVVRHDGGVLTSARLVGDAETVEVTDAHGEPHEARVVGRDPTTDLALLDADADLEAAPLADGSTDTGTRVWVVGAPAPGATRPWMSDGIVASTDALVARTDGPTSGGLLETDAGGNAWTSGGAVVNADGQVVGVVLSPVDSRTTTVAVPISDAVAVARGLREDGVAAHGSLGINGVDGPDGPMVAEVEADGAAAEAGIHAKDVVTKVAGRPVTSMAEVMAVVRQYAPGERIVVELVRGDKTMEMPVELANMNPVPTPTSQAAP